MLRSSKGQGSGVFPNRSTTQSSISSNFKAYYINQIWGHVRSGLESRCLLFHTDVLSFLNAWFASVLFVWDAGCLKSINSLRYFSFASPPGSLDNIKAWMWDNWRPSDTVVSDERRPPLNIKLKCARSTTLQIGYNCYTLASSECFWLRSNWTLPWRGTGRGLVGWWGDCRSFRESILG